MKFWMRMVWGLLLFHLSPSFAAEAILQLGQGSGLVGSQHNAVQINMQNDTTVIALQLAIADIPDFIKPDSIWTTGRSSGFTIAWEEDSLSVLHILVLSLDKKATIDKGNGAILNIGYTVLSGAERFNSLDIIFYAEPKVIAAGSLKIHASARHGYFIVGETAVETRGEMQPEQFTLEQNFPNPFNPETRIIFHLPSREHAHLEIVNVLGQTIRTLIEAELAAGAHEVTWDGLTDQGKQAAGGIYFYRLRAGRYYDCKRLAYMR